MPERHQFVQFLLLKKAEYPLTWSTLIQKLAVMSAVGAQVPLVALLPQVNVAPRARPDAHLALPRDDA